MQLHIDLGGIHIVRTMFGGGEGSRKIVRNRTGGGGGSNKIVHTLIKKSTKFKIGAFSKVDHPLFPIMLTFLLFSWMLK